jgi:hypothetical protein
MNQHPLHHEGWMINGKKQFSVVFQFLSKPWWLAQSFGVHTKLASQ